MSITLIEAKKLIDVRDDELWTDSLRVAEYFNRKHHSVVQAIGNLECSMEFSLTNFCESKYVNNRGQTQPYYKISQDGFLFLAMGFTGRKAAQFKENFILAFRKMEKELKRLLKHQNDPNRIASRQEGKLIRKLETDVIKMFVEYSKAQGSQSAERYYMAITKMEYQALFFVGKAVGKNFRDILTPGQNGILATAEELVAETLVEVMQKGIPYKEGYQLAKDRVMELAKVTGKTNPGIPRIDLTAITSPAQTGVAVQ